MLPTKPLPGLRKMHQEMSSKTESCSQLRAAVAPKLTRVEVEVQSKETIKDLNETKNELEGVRKTLLRTEEDRDMWERLFKDCNKKQREEIERLRQEYKERSERLRLATAIERSLPVGNVPRG